MTDNGIEGLPGAILLAPEGGNAVENDAGIETFSVLNIGMEPQVLESGNSNQNIYLVGEVMLENLTVAPDPLSYTLVLEHLVYNNSNPDNVTQEWTELVNVSGPIGGLFNLSVDLGAEAAGVQSYKFSMKGYTGGDTLCAPEIYNPDEECAIHFTLSIDTYAPSLDGIDVFDIVSYRELFDDTWVQPNHNQKFRIRAQDLPSPPEALTLNYWVQNDHDTNEDDEPQESEYQQLVLSSDGSSPIANYEGTISDIANEGDSGRVSLYVTGFDIAGNAISGGQPGFDYDLVTYIAMGTQPPTIDSFKIRDYSGNEFSNDQGGLRTMYAGNVYNLIVEAKDDNGWRDIEYFSIDLNPGQSNDMLLYYFPRNATTWTESPWITILNASNDTNGTEMVRRDGNRLLDPFESQFMLVMPIQIAWNCYTVSGVVQPQVRIKDLDPNQPSSVLTESGGRYKQKWVYGDGFLLDTTPKTENNQNGLALEDVSGPFISEDVYDFTNYNAVDFVYIGDDVKFTGQYVFKDASSDDLVRPEIPMTLKITRETALPDGSKGYVAWPGEVTYHLFTGGIFNATLKAPSVTNEYVYNYELLVFLDANGDGNHDDFGERLLVENGEAVFLPTGAVDYTQESTTFSIRVDGTAPKVATNSWTAKDLSDVTLDGVLPSSTIHCLNVQVILEERELLDSDSIKVNWMYFQNGLNWSLFTTAFDNQWPLSAPLSLVGGGDQTLASNSDCIDLWPGVDLPDESQLQNVVVRFWISGTDTAGLSVINGGDFDTAILSAETQHISEYQLEFLEAQW